MNKITGEMINNQYTGGDALGEIILIILVSFIFGWIARWLWDEYIVPKEYEEEIIVLDDDKDVFSETNNQRYEIKKEVIEKRGEEMSGDNFQEEKTVKISDKEEKKNIKRIEKDGQEIIIVEKEIVEEKPKRVFISPTGIRNDDLKIVEGIGPKIESLLKRNGIESWEDLSKKTADELKNILKEAGDRFTFHDPSTWPEQAMLAYENKWDELEEFQNFLSGGKRV